DARSRDSFPPRRSSDRDAYGAVERARAGAIAVHTVIRCAAGLRDDIDAGCARTLRDLDFFLRNARLQLRVGDGEPCVGGLVRPRSEEHTSELQSREKLV